uniref:NADH-ubiquinone oxidoreductase chain 1 n=1 Tax=Chorda asiatica TaxID=1281577 RepID=A0A8F0FCF1_9PHAE|nr:NADH dehydrogenase subunit 1 [Chorda asiatica]QWK44406.1 NADH dehydrogenase subunit 1 [Chorda asiatica]WBP69768.1 NADH dehydrogenase subunit 1 [Chorda asiatica]
MWLTFLTIFLNLIDLVLPLLIAVAYFTLMERKLMAGIQRRRGPNVIGYMGLLQPLADGLKLFIKETVLPTNANTVLFVLAPLCTFILSLVSWAVIPFSFGGVIADSQLGVLYFLSVSSLGVYGVLISGWSSNSKYAFLGALRSAAQMVSYEISMGISLLNVCLCLGTLNLTEIVIAQLDVWLLFPLLPVGIMFFIGCLAETNRHPFDLPEAEAELVSGYNVEYSAMGFALFFLGEYANMLAMGALTSICFLGGWLSPFGTGITSSVIWFGLKICFFVILFIVMRAILPRYRYDQLMKLGWKCFLPLSLALFFLSVGILVGFDWLPN